MLYCFGMLNKGLLFLFFFFCQRGIRVFFFGRIKVHDLYSVPPFLSESKILNILLLVSPFGLV